MTNGIKCTALAGALVLAGGSMGWAQTYNSNSGVQNNPNPGVQSSGQSSDGYGVTADTQQKIRQSLEQSGFRNVQVVPQSFVVRAQAPDGSRIVMFMSPDQFAELTFQNANQGMSGNPNANQAMSGPSSQTWGGQGWRSGYSNGPTTTEQQAQQELSRYGYSDVTDLRPAQGWTADVTKNGENVRVLLSQNGLIATFQGR
ncbi:MAG: hypothetical protein JO358_00775 [Alphaproteobacteria bacterium]|nr:hypothetical protein [Alphaproteobacteria bacterium]